MIRKTLRDFLGIIWHPTLIAVLVIGAGFATLAVFLKPEPGVATRIFSVSGTMVALVLPAAGLAGGLITRIVEYWLDRVAAGEGEDQSEKARVGSEFITEAKAIAVTAWRGSTYALFALFLSSVAAFSPGATLCWPILRVDYVLFGIALGFLLVGAFLFFPLARWIFRLEVLKDAERALQWAARP